MLAMHGKETGLLLAVRCQCKESNQQPRDKRMNHEEFEMTATDCGVWRSTAQLFTEGDGVRQKNSITATEALRCAVMPQVQVQSE